MYEKLYASDSLKAQPLSACWQWNHEPHDDLFSVSEKGLRFKTDRVVMGLEQAVNTLTQRTFGPAIEAVVTIDASGLSTGDFAGLCALQGCYCQLAATRDGNDFYLSLISREAADAPYAIAPSKELVCERARIKVDQSVQTLKVCFDFENMTDTAVFSYLQNGQWHTIGKPHHLVYRLDHFVGCRVGLFCYSTRQPGGSAVFSDFVYKLL